uniref:Uncharacterized protein n=1 Tax=Anopheles quadriannulatus TaxID=34691 RepID=A0A182XT14_ANOQN
MLELLRIFCSKYVDEVRAMFVSFGFDI